MDATTITLIASLLSAAAAGAGTWYITLLKTKSDLRRKEKQDDTQAQELLVDTRVTHLGTLLDDLRKQLGEQLKGHRAEIAQLTATMEDREHRCEQRLDELRQRCLLLEQENARSRGELEMLKTWYQSCSGKRGGPNKTQPEPVPQPEFKRRHE